MFQAALKTYDTVNKSTMSGRDIEAEVLTKAAIQIKKVQDNWSQGGNDQKLHSALKFNQRIWTILQAELEKPDNPLPKALKIDLLRLIAFIDARTLEALAHNAPEKLTILININHNIAAGLRIRSQASETSKAAA